MYHERENNKSLHSFSAKYHGNRLLQIKWSRLEDNIKTDLRSS
jgi:hypothetical protein